MPQPEQALVRCRLAKDGDSSFADPAVCAFEFPRCDGCPNVSRAVSIARAAEDPLSSEVLNGWLRGDLHAPR
jgi:hypothetical protein